MNGPTVSVPLRQYAHYEAMARARIDHIIQTHYPRHPFFVSVSLKTMLATIEHPLLPEGYAIQVRLTEEDPDGKIYVKHCGELLERFNVPRGGLVDRSGVEASPTQTAAALADIK